MTYLDFNKTWFLDQGFYYFYILSKHPNNHTILRINPIYIDVFLNISEKLVLEDYGEDFYITLTPQSKELK